MAEEQVRQGREAVVSGWERRQAWARGRDYLTATGQAGGYTVLRVPVGLHQSFFDVDEAFRARTRLNALIPHMPLTNEDVAAIKVAQQAWQEWQSWTRRMTAYLNRVAGGRLGSVPEVPRAILSLGEVDA